MLSEMGDPDVVVDLWHFELWSKVEVRCTSVHTPEFTTVLYYFWYKPDSFRKPTQIFTILLHRYQPDSALLFRDDCAFLCLDDKHWVKVGEPGFPVAAAERGKRVLVACNSTLEVGDYDFTCMSIVPFLICLKPFIILGAVG